MKNNHQEKDNTPTDDDIYISQTWGVIVISFMIGVLVGGIIGFVVGIFI